MKLLRDQVSRDAEKHVMEEVAGGGILWEPGAVVLTTSLSPIESSSQYVQSVFTGTYCVLAPW